MPADAEGLPHYHDRFTSVNGLRLHHLEWSPHRGDPVVLLHGLNVNTHTWDPIAATLAQRRRVICPDLRGHGDSDWAPDGYRLEKFVDDLHGLLRVLRLDKVDIVGHSLGARIGIAFAGSYPDVAGRLILSDTGPETPRSGSREAQAIVGSALTARGFRDEHAALEHFQALHPEWLPEFHELHVRHQLRTNWAGKLVFKSDPDLFWMTGSAGGREVPYLWDCTARISCPTLMLYGVRSQFLDDEILERMAAAIGQMEVQVFDTGHYIPREQPDAFAEAVGRFLGPPS